MVFNSEVRCLFWHFELSYKRHCFSKTNMFFFSFYLSRWNHVLKSFFRHVNTNSKFLYESIELNGFSRFLHTVNLINVLKNKNRTNRFRSFKVIAIMANVLSSIIYCNLISSTLESYHNQTVIRMKYFLLSFWTVWYTIQGRCGIFLYTKQSIFHLSIKFLTSIKSKN